uniref:Elongation factor P n=1 Tax=Chrysotila carterae TaxID=13221 RepID=A0A7S4FC50_CHRCT
MATRLLCLLCAAVAAAALAPARLAATHTAQLMRTASRSGTVCMGNTNDFKVGLTIEFDNSVWRVQEFLHVKPGKGSAFVRSKLKNLETGSTLEKTWKAGEAFPDAQVDKEEMQYSYDDGDDMVFMNMETFEEERIPRADIAKNDFIKEEMLLTVLKWRGKAIDVQVPKSVQLKVAETEPGAKGNTAQGRTEKPATLETGAVVNVPIFIETGELIKVDTDDRKYLGRVN